MTVSFEACRKKRLLIWCYYASWHCRKDASQKVSNFHFQKASKTFRKWWRKSWATSLSLHFRIVFIYISGSLSVFSIVMLVYLYAGELFTIEWELQLLRKSIRFVKRCKGVQKASIWICNEIDSKAQREIIASFWFQQEDRNCMLRITLS